MQAAKFREIGYGIMSGCGGRYSNICCKHVGKHFKIVQIHDGLELIFTALIKCEYAAVVSVLCGHGIRRRCTGRQICDSKCAHDVFQPLSGDISIRVTDKGLQAERF